jgi:hypothetical protein
MPGIADKFTQSAQGRLLWPGMTSFVEMSDSIVCILRLHWRNHQHATSIPNTALLKAVDEDSMNTPRYRLLMPVAIAVALGPLIAGLAVCLLAIATNLFDPTISLPMGDWFTMLGIYIAVAYLEGGIIALLAGIMVSIWTIWRPPGLIVVTAAAAIATALYYGAINLFGAIALAQNFVFTLIVAVIAASVCWLLFRRYASAMPATSK